VLVYDRVAELRGRCDLWLDTLMTCKSLAERLSVPPGRSLEPIVASSVEEQARNTFEESERRALAIDSHLVSIQLLLEPRDPAQKELEDFLMRLRDPVMVAQHLLAGPPFAPTVSFWRPPVGVAKTVRAAFNNVDAPIMMSEVADLDAGYESVKWSAIAAYLGGAAVNWFLTTSPPKVRLLLPPLTGDEGA
jgi:hypothetical protein